MEPASIDLWAVAEPYLRALLELCITSLIGAVVLYLRQQKIVTVSTEARDAITTAINRKAQATLRRYGEDLRGSLTVTVNHPAVAEVAEYIETQLPKRMKQIGMDADAVRNMAATELERILGTELPPPREMTEEEVKKQMIVLLDQLQQLQNPTKGPST